MDPPERLFVDPREKNSYETLPPDYKKTISLFISLMKFIGIDFFGAKLGFSNMNASVRLFLFAAAFLPITLPTYSFAFKLGEFESFLHAAAVIPTFIISTLDYMKLFAVLLWKNEIKELMLEIGELWPRRLGDGEKNSVVTNWLRRTTLIMKVFFIYTSVNMLAFYFVPFLMTIYNLFTGANEYLLPMVCPGPWLVNSTMVYLASFAWECTLMPCHICLYHTYDILIIVNTFNISIIFRALQVDLKEAIQASCATRKNMKVLDEDFDNIKKVIITHQKVFSLVDKLNNCFGFVVFVHTGLSALLICFFGFMTVAYSDLVRTIANLFSSFDMSITVFLLALAGQLLLDTSTGVADAAYDSAWYDSDLKVQKLVVFVIIRSQHPCYLNALNFSTMTLATFSKILSSAWTYLSLLTQMYERN